MNHRLRMIKSALVFLFLLSVLFGALALLPALAQTPGSAQSDKALSPLLGDASMLLGPSRTGYIVDDGDPYPYFRRSLTTDWVTVTGSGGWNNDYLYALANNSGDWAEWHPDLQTGWYEVWVHYYAFANRRDDVEYKVYHAGGVRTHRINQRLLADGSDGSAGANSDWVLLGTYRFLGNTYFDYVQLSDATTPSGTPTPGYVIADAVKFAPLEVWVDDDYYDMGMNDGKLWGVNAFNRIQDGLLAVASNGTVWVKPGTYVGPITVTKGITLTSTGGASSTVITVTASAGTAVWMLASGATVKGFTIESNGAEWGIADGSTGLWNWEIVNYRVTNNIVRGFGNGIVFYRASGEVSYNQVYSNTKRGIWIQEFPTSAPASTSVLSNTLYGNGGPAADYDIQIHDSYTGTTVMGNNITGSGGSGEAGIFVYNAAGDLVLANNTLRGCTEGVLILQDSGTNIIQKVNLYRNEITGNSTGIRVRRTGGSASLRQITIGGSLANSNRIYNNTGYEVRLTGYSPNITATHNYWGVCTWREIEDEIYHDYDSAALGLVTYEPAICVPARVDVQVVPLTLPADGVSTAVVTATAYDFFGSPVSNGTMIGITTTLGSVPYAYVEESDPSISWSGSWGPGSHACASGGQYAGTGDPAARVSWSFNGTAVSLVYLKVPGGGQADVFIDGSTTASKRIDMSTSIGTIEWRVEEVITNALSATGPHTITVAPVAGGPIWIDAFRSGGTVAGQGRIVTLLTSALVSDTATVWASVYNGRIVTDCTLVDVQSVVTDTENVLFQGTNVGVLKSASPSQLSPGQQVTYVITYTNSGPARATNVVITDTLPADFQYVSHRSSPSLPAPQPSPPITYVVWNVGSLAPRATGVITLVARPDPSASWPSTPDLRTNVVQISTSVTDTNVGNDQAWADVTVVPNPPAFITVTAYPTAIPANGVATSVITAEVRDQYHNPVLDGTPVTFTTSLAGTLFPSSGSATGYGSTTGGFATITLRAGTLAGMTTITATAGTARGTTRVQLVALEPYSVTISAHPSVIRVSRSDITSTLRVTVTDQYANLVHGAAVTLTTDAGTLQAPGGITGSEVIVTTTNGIALAGLASDTTVTTATVTAAITTTGRPTATTQVYFQAGLPYTITSEAYPTTVRVCGDEAIIRATIKDEFDNLVEDGTHVSFLVVPGERGDMYPREARTVNGVVTSTLRTKAYLFGQRFLDVYITAGPVGHQVMRPQHIDLEVGLAAAASFRLSPTPIQAGGLWYQLEMRIRDCAGNNVQDGTVVTLTSSLGTITPTVTSVANGLALATFRTGCEADWAVLSATADSRTFTTTLLIEPGKPDHVSVDISPTTILNCGGRAVVTATLRDVCNNLVKDGTQVQFASHYGYVTVSPHVASTQRGVVTATVVADRNKKIEPRDWPTFVEQVDVTSPPALSDFVNVFIRPGLPRHITLQADPEEIPILGDVNGYNITVVAAVYDCSGTPVLDGTAVRVQTDKGIFLETASWYVDQTTVGGLVTVTLTSQSVAGRVNITATAGSAVGTTHVYFKPGEPLRISVWPHPDTICADGLSRSQITAQVFDFYGNEVGAGVTVTFVTDFGHFLGVGDTYVTTTQEGGYAFATLISDTQPRTATVLVNTENLRQGYCYAYFVECRRLYLPLIIRRR
nr:DUF11 domain-containing protein [Chloroflexota bacterium]